MADEQYISPPDTPDGDPSDPLKDRKISQNELGQLQEEHKKWLLSDGKEGRRAFIEHAENPNAILARANLQKAKFYYVDLREAILWKTNLEEASLECCNLQRSNLVNANLQASRFVFCNLREANLSSAKMRNAILRNSDLEFATGLLAGQLAGVDVSRAKLPKDIHEFKGLEQVEKISHNAKKLFLSMLLVCVYCWLTIATTTDLNLITNAASSALPIIGTEIPIVGFYIAAPLLLLSVYVWMHLYLQHLWKGLADLPAVFPDGKPLDEKVYPWLINGLVRAHVPFLKEDRPLLSKLQVGLSILLAWWVVPLTLLLLWGRFLVRHDWPITAFYILLIGLSFWFSILFYELAKRTLRGEGIETAGRKTFLKEIIYYKHHAVQVGLGILLFLSLGAIFSPYKGTPQIYSNIMMGYSPFADLVEQNVSENPPNLTGSTEKEKELAIGQVKGAHLKGQNLRHANMRNAFLVKADLRGAQLQEANLERAEMRSAKLRNADLQRANLRAAQLQAADLLGANLKESDLFEAELFNANLKGARLEMSNLDKANLVGTKYLTSVQVKGTRNWGLAYYDPGLLVELGLPNAHNENLKRKKLRSYPFSGFNLKGADLNGFDLTKIHLEMADLREANLFGVNLNNASLRKANLQEADLVGADLRKANLQEADLVGTKLGGADLQGADLQGANLQGAKFEKILGIPTNFTDANLLKVKNLRQEISDSACSDGGTKFPEGFKPLPPCPKKKDQAP